jgi:hypothetical protein
MNTKIELWIHQASESTLEKSTKQYPDCVPNQKFLTFDKGRKYYKVIVESMTHSKSVYCFIDFDGNIYKAAGYNAPAKGIRGNIDTIDPKTINGCTSWLYR